jgi:5-methylthioadenosine/S-adenosylhomocysteine deaminase
MSEEFVRDGTRLAVAEMLRSGTTCFNDMYFFPNEVGRVAGEAGIRCVVGLILIDSPTAWARDADEYIAKGTEVHDRFKNDPLVATAFAPHAPYSVSDASLTRIRVLADELDIPIHMHVHETKSEVQAAVAETGERPLERLERLALLGPRLLAVHMTQLTEAEIERLSECGASVVHCPESNLKLASGFCPVQALGEAGVNVALGTDGAASNNDLDMLGEMRSAAYLAKGVARSASAVPAARALSMATLHGAKALGLHARTGSLARGKAADVVALDLSQIETTPVFDAIAQIVYACSRQQVSDVWVAGRQLLDRRRLVTLDEPSLAANADKWRERLTRPTARRA